MDEESKVEETEADMAKGKQQQLEEVKEVEAAVDQDLFAGEDGGADEDIDFDWEWDNNCCETDIT